MQTRHRHHPLASAATAHLPPASVPSRHTNPFATCWTRPGALRFRFAGGMTAERLVAQLAARSGQGAIIGAHGSGKSTLLATMLPLLEARRRRVIAVVLHDGQRRLPRAVWQDLTQNSGPAGTTPSVVVVDGYEQLGWWEQARLRRHCRRTSSGLLVTAHRPVGLPTLVHLEPDVQQILELVRILSVQCGTPITAADVADSCARHGSNVREIFFDLYDRHEQLRRTALNGR